MKLRFGMNPIQPYNQNLSKTCRQFFYIPGDLPFKVSPFTFSSSEGSSDSVGQINFKIRTHPSWKCATECEHFLKYGLSISIYTANSLANVVKLLTCNPLKPCAERIDRESREPKNNVVNKQEGSSWECWPSCRDHRWGTWGEGVGFW